MPAPAGAPHRMAAYLPIEAIANEVLGAFGCPWACLYDTRAHSRQTLRDAHQTHPRLLDPTGREVANADYLADLIHTVAEKHPDVVILAAVTPERFQESIPDLITPTRTAPPSTGRRRRHHEHRRHRRRHHPRR